MRKSNEKGITLVALVTTIILLLILASIGVNSGKSTIELAKFEKFKEELKLLQTKVNELNQTNQVEIGDGNPTQAQKNLISDILDINEDIINEFKICSKGYIKNTFNLEVERDYLINVQHRYVFSTEGVEYKSKTYYTMDQIDDGYYNVQYSDKNPATGNFDFDVNYTNEGDRWKIQVSNIQYSGYIDNWQVKYRYNDDDNWTTINSLSFYVRKTGNYYVQVLHDDINLGSKLIEIEEENNEISNEITNEVTE